jgi:hypothetical protein
VGGQSALSFPLLLQVGDKASDPQFPSGSWWLVANPEGGCSTFGSLASRAVAPGRAGPVPRASLEMMVELLTRAGEGGGYGGWKLGSSEWLQLVSRSGSPGYPYGHPKGAGTTTGP